jgi:hypothetical protein
LIATTSQVESEVGNADVVPEAIPDEARVEECIDWNAKAVRGTRRERDADLTLAGC